MATAFLICLCAVLLGAVIFLVVMLRAEERRAEEYHKRADEMQLELEPVKMERDEWEQRCAFLTDRLARLEGSQTGSGSGAV